MKNSAFWSGLGKKFSIVIVSIVIPLGIIFFVMLLEFLSKNIK